MLVGCRDTSAPREKTADDANLEPKFVGTAMTLALVGPKVVQYPTPHGAAEHERFVLRGVRRDGGCRFHYSFRVPVGQQLDPAWGVYYDLASCTVIMARGDYDFSGEIANRRKILRDEMQDEESYGTYDGSESLTTATQLVRHQFAANHTDAMGDQNTTQFRYTLSPDCVKQATTVHAHYWWSANDPYGVWTITEYGAAFFSLGRWCGYFDMGTLSSYDLDGPGICPAGHIVHLGYENHVFLDFAQGALWREYDGGWNDDFGSQCWAGASYFQPQVITNPPAGLV